MEENNFENECSCHCHKHGEGESCSCGENCTCGDECKCGENCTCAEEQAPENCNCVTDDKELASQYLNMAKQVQADFENFRRHAIEDIKLAKTEGQRSVIEVFLPCLDTFKEAKKSINDDAVKKGVEMIEDKILQALESLGVTKIPAIGEVYDPYLHEAIMTMQDESKENDIILEEYQGGYKFKDRVIRHSKVIVNKKEN